MIAIADGVLGVRPWTADGQSDSDAPIELWSFRTRASLGALPMSAGFTQFVLASNGRYAAGSYDGEGGSGVRVWDTASRTLVGEFEGRGMRFSPDGSRLVVESAAGLVVRTLPDLATSDRFDVTAVDPSHSILDLSLTNSGDLAAITDFGLILRWVHGNPVLDTTIRSDSGSETGWIAVSPDGRRAAVSIEGALQVWSLDEAQQLSPPARAGATGFTWDVLFSTDGTNVVTLDSDGLLQFWSLGASGPLAQHVTISGGDWSATSDGTRIATRANDGEVAIWNTTTGAREGVLHVAGDDIEIAPSGGVLLAFDDEELSIWDVHAATRTATLAATADEEAIVDGGNGIANVSGG